MPPPEPRWLCQRRRDRPNAPFRCLDAQYRRELVRVYLTNVEALARKFVDEKRDALARLRGDAGGLRAFWAAVDARTRRQLATASGEAVLKARQAVQGRLVTVAVSAAQGASRGVKQN